MINSINASQRCQLTYHSFTYAYLCVCVILGIYLYETNIPFIKYIDEALAYGSYIGSKSHFSGKIGRFSSIASECVVIRGRHPYTYPFVTTCPMFFSQLRQNGHTFANKQLFDEFKYAEPGHLVSVGSDCWIGYGVKIVEGVNIADGAMILAGAVVTKDVPPYAIVGGVPAKVKGYRFDEETIDFLLETRWWNKPVIWLKEHWELFSDIDQLKKLI